MAYNTMTSLSVAAALAGAVSLAAVATPTQTAQAQQMVKCYGISLAGANDCANAAGTHSCAGQSTVDYDGGEWKLVEADKCDEPGSTEPFAGVGGPIDGVSGSDPTA